MTKRIFINLPVTDVAASSAFYEAIGCVKDARFSGEHGASMLWSDTIAFMLVAHDFYRTLTPKSIIDAKTNSGVLIALSLDSRDAVDRFAVQAVAAGGREAHGAEDEGFMYSRGIEDPDGHGLGPFWMEAEAAPPATAETQAAG